MRRSKLTTLLRSLGVLAIGWALSLYSVDLSHAAELPAVASQASATSVRVAEPFSVEWTISASKGAKVTFPAHGEKLGDFDVVAAKDFFDIPDAKAAGVRTWTRQMTLESILTGDLHIPALEFQVHEEAGLQVIHSQPIAINVVSVLEDRGDPTKFRDIQSVVDVPVPDSHSSTWAWWKLGGAAGLTLLAIAALAILRRKRWVTPRHQAMRELDDLEAASASQKLGNESSTAELANIILRFLRSQFGITQSGHTSHEVLRTIRIQHGVPEDMIQRIDALFTLAEKIKFAGIRLSDTEFKRAIQEARSLVVEVADASDLSVAGHTQQNPAQPTSNRHVIASVDADQRN